MEQAAGYWMWSKPKHDLSSHHFQAPNNSSYDDSWEEQAFAEDAAGPLGGCVWPPRSYSCSFCRREFRSAQALGGHMNVHRRDRARLKQSPPTPPSHQNESHHHHHDQYQNNNPYASIGTAFQYPSQVCTLVYNPNPNSDPVGIIASPSSLRVSAPPTKANSLEKTFLPSFTSPIFEDHKKRSPSSSPQSWPNMKNSTRILESGSCRVKADNYAKGTDLSVSLNLVVRRTCPSLSDGNNTDEADNNIGCKRRRIAEASSLPFFLKPRVHHLQSEEQHHELSPNTSIDELDLELRLGDRPKVK